MGGGQRRRSPAALCEPASVSSAALLGGSRGEQEAGQWGANGPRAGLGLRNPRPGSWWVCPSLSGGLERTPSLWWGLGLPGGAGPWSRIQPSPGAPGALHPVLSCRRGGGRCCFISLGEWEASGKSSWEVPGGSGGVGSCCPAGAGSQRPPRTPSLQSQGSGMMPLDPPARPPLPTTPQLWPPLIPGCACRAPREGRGGGTARSEQRVPMQPSICASCQRQTGMWGIWCMWG